MCDQYWILTHVEGKTLALSLWVQIPTYWTCHFEQIA